VAMCAPPYMALRSSPESAESHRARAMLTPVVSCPVISSQFRQHYAEPSGAEHTRRNDVKPVSRSPERSRRASSPTVGGSAAEPVRSSAAGQNPDTSRRVRSPRRANTMTCAQQSIAKRPRSTAKPISTQLDPDGPRWTRLDPPEPTQPHLTAPHRGYPHRIMYCGLDGHS
jgi:hypothetical protein